MSVAIPAYNAEAHLAESLGSVLAQSASLSEVRVFDNASTDNTVEIARSLLPPEDVLVADRNHGAVVNFNRAARTATGDYFMWVAADDRLAPTYVERCLELLRSSPDAPACLTGIRFIDPAGNPHRNQTDADLASPDARTRLRSFLRRRRWTEFYCLYRRDRLLASPLVSAHYGADVLLTWWFLLRGPLAVTTDLLLDYREYPSKTVSETAQSLDPDAPTTYWRMRELWHRLRRMTHESDVDPAVGRAARRELLLALAHPTWWLHLLSDAWERWPRLQRAARRVWDLVGQPGRLAPRASDEGSSHR